MAITRIEIISKRIMVGRKYVLHDCKVESIHFQDNGRTMKIFIDEK